MISENEILVEILHAYGFCVSYQELRLFMTSLAEDEVRRIKDGIYIPSSVIPVNEGSSFKKVMTT